MIKIIPILLLTFLGSKTSQTLKPEQVAYDYFVKEIFPKKYPESNKIFFNGTAGRYNYTIYPFYDCFKDSGLSDGEFIGAHNKLSMDEIEIKKITPGIKYLRSHRAKQLNVSIFRSVQFKGSEYIYIHVYLEYQFVDHFLIQITNDDKVSYCEKGEVI